VRVTAFSATYFLPPASARKVNRPRNDAAP
jgi:hypothetical protein